MNQEDNEQQQHPSNTTDIEMNNPNPQHPDNNNNAGTTNTDSENPNNSIDDDAITEINITSTPSSNYNTPQLNNRLWTDAERGSYEERRRETLNQELNRVQRSNFIHFMILCFIPMLLIGLVLFNSFVDSGECIGYANLVCRREPRHFMNGYSNGCICDAFNLTVIGGDEV